MASSSAHCVHRARQTKLFARRIAVWLFCVLSLAHLVVAQSEHVGQVSVRVRDRSTEGQLEQARVQLIRFPDGILSEQFTGSDGGVVFSGISVGAYTIRATRQGYEPGETRVDFRRGDSTVQSVDIHLTTLDKDGPEAPSGRVSTQGLQIPDSAKKQLERGMRLLNEKKNPRESIAAFQRAIDIFPNYTDAYFLMGTAQMQINDAQAAEVSLRKSIALDSRRTSPYYPLAMLLFGQRRFDDEQDLLLAAKKSDPADWRWPYELARCEAQKGKWDRALQYALEAGTNRNSPSKVHLLLADIYANSNHPAEAVAELELFTQLDPQSTYMNRVREVLPTLRQRAASRRPE